MIKKECFTNQFIESRAGANIHRKKMYEKVVYAFYLLERLSYENLPFIFKGGTSLMLLLEEFNRFSVDIDILMEKGMEIEIIDIINTYADEVFYKVEEDIRKPIEIIKRHFKFYYKSIYQVDLLKESFILLDVVFDSYKYHNLQSRPIESHFVKTTNPLLQVTIPSIDEMLGDKLTAFAPRTIGILFKRSGQYFSKHTEIIKQLYDISKLCDKMENFSLMKEVYTEIAKIQLSNRKLDISVDQCILDTISTCKLILTEGKNGGTKEEYEILKKGYEGFKNYIVHDFRFQELLIMSTKVYILCIRMQYGDSDCEMARPIDTFIGKKWRYIQQTIGLSLYEKLMVACATENQSNLLHNSVFHKVR